MDATNRFKTVTSLPEFPANNLGLRRGTILESAHIEVERQLGLTVGKRTAIGFDGEFVRSAGCTWSIEQLGKEINLGFWKVVGCIDFTDDFEISRQFAQQFEHLILRAN